MRCFINLFVMAFLKFMSCYMSLVKQRLPFSAGVDLF